MNSYDALVHFTKAWRTMKRGLIISGDESEVIGTFHHARNNAGRMRKLQIEACITNSERACELLRAAVNMMRQQGRGVPVDEESRARLYAAADWILTVTQK